LCSKKIQEQALQETPRPRVPAVIAFLDADDLWEPQNYKNKLILDANKLPFFFSFGCIDEYGKLLHKE
jgi:hypothetical protein